jgi:hypothetical protein
MAYTATNYDVYAAHRKILESPARSAMGQTPSGHLPSGSWIHPAQVSEVLLFIGGIYPHFLRPSHPVYTGFL